MKLDDHIAKMKAPALTEPGPWYLDSYGSAHGKGMVWIIQRDMPPAKPGFGNGYEFLKTPNGNKRRFRTEAGAAAVMRKLNKP